jgi:NADH-quinone oxidoreductase subunit M
MFFGPSNVLTWATFAPLAGAALIVVLAAIRYSINSPQKSLDQAARAVALVASGISLVAAIAAWMWYDPHAPGMVIAGKDTGVQLVQKAVWIRAFNVEYFVGVDGLSISMATARTATARIRATRTPSTSRCGWCPATWSCCSSCRRA